MKATKKRATYAALQTMSMKKKVIFPATTALFQSSTFRNGWFHAVITTASHDWVITRGRLLTQRRRASSPLTLPAKSAP